MKFINRIGEINKNKESLGGYEMKIIEYNRNDDIWIEFQDEHKAKVHTSYSNFKKGQVKNPFHPSVYDIGYIGQGKYNSIDKSGKKTKAYNTWINMLMRCYDPYYINKNLTYIDCYVCDEWLNFQNFAEWFYKHYYEIENERMELDKDILCKGNKIYSPKTCIFVPQRINVLFVKRKNDRGDYPIGINPDKRNKCLLVGCCILDKNEKNKKKYLGQLPLNEPFHAFYTYKQFKEKVIKQVADEYKDLIPIELYNALYRYKVEIND